MIDNKSQLMKRMLLLPLVSSLSTSCGASHQHQLKPGLFKPDHTITPLARLKQTKKTNRRFKKKQTGKGPLFLANLKKLKHLPYGIIKKGGHRYRKLKQANQDKREQLLNEYAIFGYLRHASSTNFPKIEAILAERLAEGSLDINTAKCRGESLLAYAMKGYEEATHSSDKDVAIEAIKLLIRNGANPSLPGKVGYSHYDHIPILTAASKQDQRLFEALLVGDLDVFTAVDSYGRNIFHAILNSHQCGLNVDFLDAALKHTCFEPEMLNQKKHVNGTTPLHYAASKNLEALGLLIQAGANLNVKDVEGNTPLHYAIGKTVYQFIEDITEGVQMLLLAGGNSLLKGANPYLENNKKERAIDWSRTKLKHFTSNERREIISLCIRHGISDVIRPIISPVHFAVRNNDVTALNQALAENPGAINEKDGSGNTPLFNAISLRNELCARDLITAGADLNMLSNDGKTILYPLVNPGEKNVACLTELCHSVSRETINATTLSGNAANIHYAAGYDNEILGVLVAFGADINKQDVNGDTPLHYVVTRHTTRLPSEDETASMLEAVQLLCAHKADVTLKNKDHKTAIDLAKETNEAVYTFLMQQRLPAYAKSSSSSGCRSSAEGIMGKAVQPGLVY